MAGSSSVLLQVMIPGLPDELSLLCLAKLPFHVLARCRAVSRSWLFPLSRPPPLRLPQPLVCFCTGLVHPITRDSSMAWVLVSPSDLVSFCFPFFHLPKPPSLQKVHVYSSKVQLIGTGTTLLLVRARLQFTANGPQVTPSNGRAVLDLSRENDDAYQALIEPGALQGFDLWRMKWCRDIVGEGGRLRVMPMHVDRWSFAAAHSSGYVYVAGGEGTGAGPTAERLDMETGRWEMLPDMIKDRSEMPTGFVVEGCFFVAGGEFGLTTSTQGRGLTQSIEYYDPEKKVWTMMEGMWPEEMWGYMVNVVVVVKGAAFAKGAEAEVVRLTRTGERWWRWEEVGVVPLVEEATEKERWMVRLVSVGEEELWAIVGFQDPVRPLQEMVFACRPHLHSATGRLQWHSLPLSLPTLRILASAGIYL